MSSSLIALGSIWPLNEVGVPWAFLGGKEPVPLLGSPGRGGFKEEGVARRTEHPGGASHTSCFPPGQGPHSLCNVLPSPAVPGLSVGPLGAAHWHQAGKAWSVAPCCLPLPVALLALSASAHWEPRLSRWKNQYPGRWFSTSYQIGIDVGPGTFISNLGSCPVLYRDTNPKQRHSIVHQWGYDLLIFKVWTVF